MGSSEVVIIKPSKNVEVKITIDDRMMADYADCEAHAYDPEGSGKPCGECSLDIPGCTECIPVMFPVIEPKLRGECK